VKWIERLNDCVAYLEDNLDGDVDWDVLCDKACLSRLYFSRLFEAATGTGVSEYMRRRKMTLAVKDLLSGRKVIDVALDYGYSSPEAFSRAFKSVHAIAPSRVGDNAATLKSYHRISFTISIKGDRAMNYRLEKKDAFKVLGASIETTGEEGKNYVEIPRFWQESNQNGLMKRMEDLSPKDECYGICFDGEGNSPEFRYAIAVDYAGGETGEFETMEIPAAEWAVFESVGPMPSAIQEVWKRIFSEWLPATGYGLESGPQIECYYPGDPGSADYRCEVWIPITRK
jgi:AraC family transcriptional regulator